MALSLCIDTSSKNCSVAVFENSKLISVKEKNLIGLHSEKVNVFVDILLKEKKISFSDFDFFGISNGPGSFTGLRIGLLLLKLFVLLIKTFSERIFNENNV